jgi:hypothetical protein
MQENLNNRNSRPESPAARKQKQTPNRVQARQPQQPKAAAAARPGAAVRPKPSALAINTTPGVGYESVVPVVTIDYPESGLAAPEAAEFWDGHDTRTNPDVNLGLLSVSLQSNISSGSSSGNSVRAH